MYDVLLKDGMLVLPDNVFNGDLALKAGRIAALGTHLEGEAAETVDVSGKLVLPGAVDPHVHMELPVGGTCSCDDFLTGTRAAAAGGVTTILDFTVGSRETTMMDDLSARLRAAAPSIIDYGFHAEMVGWTPARLDEMREVAERGIRSFKFFTAYAASGRRTENGPLFESMKVASELGAVAAIHAEDESLIQARLALLEDSEKERMTALGLSRPDLCEALAVRDVTWLAERTGAQVHIMHLSSALGLEAVREARLGNTDVTAETCPHYLLLTDEVYERDDARFYSASPALRKEGDLRALWDALASGTVNFLSTDHCPFSRAQKEWKGSFDRLPYGLGSVELMLPLTYSEGVLEGRLSLCDLAERTAAAAARRYGLWPRKGSLLPGSDADIAVLDPTSEWMVCAETLFSSCDFSPYEGLRIRGRIERTYSRGELVYSRGTFPARPGRGLFLAR